ncbi:hypothetical protein HHI36_006588 [Cryptolaemus montrouzieri]|uniref:MADF domain-containing protein n=1 Tax=Cryptolaemus montrouzieri TaxID=559131 RepID=A0ABD2NXV3_9CUCU
MNVPKLIAMVQKYEELYKVEHPYYSNQQRRDHIWEEIGNRLNQSGNVCKERWTRIRDNHRKALILRKTKGGQPGSKLKPPKYFQELSFLAPYLNDGEERCSDLSPELLDNNESGDTLSTSSMTSLRTGSKKLRYSASEGPTAASVLQEYLSRSNRNQSDPLTEFFMNMAKTVKTFPIHDQVQIKAQLFQMVNSVEMRLALTSTNHAPSVTLPPPPQLN